MAETLLLDDTSNLNTVTYGYDYYSIYQGPGERVGQFHNVSLSITIVSELPGEAVGEANE